MLEAEVARLHSPDPTLHFSKTYLRMLELLMAALPLAAIGYFQFFVDARPLFLPGWGYGLDIVLATLLCALSSYLARNCHARDGTPFWRWTAVGLLAGTVLFAMSGLAMALLPPDRPLSPIYERGSRLALAICLLAGARHAGLPPDAMSTRASGLRFWLGWAAAIASVAVAVGVALLAVPGSPSLLGSTVEALNIALALAGILVLRRQAARLPAAAFFFVPAMALFAQAAFAAMLAEPWSHHWWLAHAIALTALVVLSYGTVRAAIGTTPSPSRPDGLLDRLADANRELEAALAQAKAVNTSLGDRYACALRTQQEFETLFALAPEATLLVAADGRIVRANAKAQRLFGCPAEELQRRMAWDFMPASAFPDHVPADGAADRDPATAERVPAWRCDGSSFLAEVSFGQLFFGQQLCHVATVRDITETKRALDKVQQSEEHFRDIFDHAPIGMALAAPDGRFLEVNESLCGLLGYGRDDLLATSLQDITHPDDRNDDSSLFDQLLGGGINTFRVEKRLVHRNGTVVWALFTASLQREINGDPLHILAQIVDIGAIKAARDALAESERRLQRVLEGSNDGFWDRHIPSGATTFSQRWATMLGYGSNEIAPSVGSWENLVHPDDLPLCRRLLAQHLSGQRDRYEAVYRMRHRDGHWVWILARGKAYEWDADGNPVRMAGTHTDVTVRQLTMEALRMREQTLKAVLEALPIGIWIGNAEGRITSANAAALALGPGIRYRTLAQDEHGDDGWGEAGRTIAPHDWALTRAIERREKVGEQLVEIELADGSKRTVLNSGLPILDEHGSPLGAVAVNQDMTNWLKLEQDLLQRSQQLEESNRELEQFAYVASHDLQEPLRKVSSFAQLFAKKYSDRLDQTGQTYIDFMVDGASRMQTLVDDLLHYSRLTRGDRSRHEVDMNQVMQGVLADLQLTIREADAEVRSGALPVILGDAGQLRALLQNLISNAVKYRAQDRRPLVEIGAREQAEEVVFWVRDNGIGIDPRYFERIFVIFQRLHARSEYPGTGIGLAICKKIVDNHGGRIWVESAPDQGATFYFTLRTGDIKK